MMMKTFLPLILSIALIASIPNFSSATRMMGGRTEIRDVKSNKEIQELGKFSIDRYNSNYANSYLRLSQNNDNNISGLRFVEVVKAESQVVSGIKYFLTVRAREGGNAEPRLFEAQVVVQPWHNQPKTLLKFSPLTKSK